MPKDRSVNVKDMIPLEPFLLTTTTGYGVGKNRVNGALFILLEIRPINLGLLDEEEIVQLLNAYHSFLHSLDRPVYLYAMDVAPNMEEYLERVRARAHEAETRALHAAALAIYGQLQSMLAGQKMRQKRFFLALTQPPQAASLPTAAVLPALFSSSARQQMRHRQRQRLDGPAEALGMRARDAAAHLTRIGLLAHILSPEEMLNLLREAYDPTRPRLSWEQVSRWIADEELPR